ncbi:MAG: Uma2 family endonuclease [Roseiflexus sp.]|nr:Uma2 family endonuclease [Roseiflexus sp.]
MAIDTDQRLALAMTIPGAPVWRLSLEQYHRMIQTGILTDDDPVEFLEGLLVTKMPKNPPRSLTTYLTRDALARVVPAQWYVDAQEPFTTADSEPEPDVLRHLQAQDVALVVEVADATLQRDRTLKKRMYARAMIPVYWIINLAERMIEWYTRPFTAEGEADYAQRQDVAEDGMIPVVLDGVEVARLPVRDLLP